VLEETADVQALGTCKSDDPRPFESRRKLLDATESLLTTVGPNAVTVDAVLNGANVSRATLYRHFGSGIELVAAAICRTLPAAPTLPCDSSLRDRLIRLLDAQAEIVRGAPHVPNALRWLELQANDDPRTGHGGGHEVRALRTRLDVIFVKPLEALIAGSMPPLGPRKFDPELLFPLLLSPILAYRGTEPRRCVEAAVDGFLLAHR
jgi:AcrR family transcriptional regulator